LQRLTLLLGVLIALASAAPAAASDWLPHPADATWTFSWTDSVYQTTATKEKVTVKETKGTAFTLAWTTQDLDPPNPDDAAVSIGTVAFQDSPGGVINTDWSSNPPPAAFPILCASISGCGNSLASTYYNLIWGTRVPVLAEPVLKGVTWSSTGGARGDVTSACDYVGTEQLSVPAFQGPVAAAKVRCEVTQAGALGDPYGSGVRTTWWVYGVGPAKIEFDHSGGTAAPVTTSVLQSTNQTPKTPPGDANYFPLEKGLKGTYRWQNTKYFKKPEVEKFVVDQVVNASARISVNSTSGPIKVAGAYGFTSRLDGITNLWGLTKAASLAKLPKLGPSSAPVDKRRHFFTPFDLMTFGFNPVIPAYPAAGASWAGTTSGRDYAIYGVTGTTTIVGVQKVTVPAGTFQALAVKSTLKQAGFPFGSGTRTSWFAPGKGLVKLVFRHGDGSVSTVELIK
jgi:hypothetical protein